MLCWFLSGCFWSSSRTWDLEPWTCPVCPRGSVPPAFQPIPSLSQSGDANGEGSWKVPECKEELDPDPEDCPLSSADLDISWLNSTSRVLRTGTSLVGPTETSRKSTTEPSGPGFLLVDSSVPQPCLSSCPSSLGHLRSGYMGSSRPECGFTTAVLMQLSVPENQDQNQPGPRSPVENSEPGCPRRTPPEPGRTLVVASTLVRFTWSHLSHTLFYLCEVPNPAPDP